MELFERKNSLCYKCRRMNSQFLKRCGMVALSIAVLYAGVAWTMEKCLRHDGHSEHVAIENHDQTQAAWESDRSQDASVPVIHCAPLSAEIGPAARAASAEIRRSDRGVSLHAASPTDVFFAVLRNDLWLEALFKRIVTFSLPIDLPRHLVLSVLRI
jgi:hypothetical protein